MANDELAWSKWSQLVAEAWRDDQLKQRLIARPAAVLQEHGIEVPAGIEVRVVENTDKVRYLTLPPKPVGSDELTAGQLSGVTGGLFATLSTVYSGSSLKGEPTGPPHTGSKGDPYEDRD